MDKGRYLELNGDPLDGTWWERKLKSWNAGTDALLAAGLVAVAPNLTTAFAAVAAVGASHLITDRVAKFQEKVVLSDAVLSRSDLVIDTKPDKTSLLNDVYREHADRARFWSKTGAGIMGFVSAFQTLPLALLVISKAVEGNNPVMVGALIIYTASFSSSLAARSARMARNFNKVTNDEWAIVERPKPEKKEAEQGEGELSRKIRDWLRSLGRGRQPALQPANVSQAPKPALVA